MCNERSEGLWPVLPFVITVSLVVAMIVYGLHSGERGNYWFICVPGVGIIIFPWAKLATMAIRGYWKFGAVGRARSEDESSPEVVRYREAASKWWRITILTWILTFFAMMIGVGIFPQPSDYDGTRSFSGGEQSSKAGGSATETPGSESGEIGLVRRYEPGEIESVSIPLFLEGTATGERLTSYEKVLHILYLLPFAAVVVGAVFLVRSLAGQWWRSGRKTPLTWKIVCVVGIAGFVVPIQLVFTVGGSMTKTVIAEVNRFLADVSDEPVVLVNRERVSDPEKIISELAGLGPTPAHHSHPTMRIRIDVIENNRRLTLELGRDSERSAEYWVFYPGYRSTKLNEIGRITTTVFDKY